MSIEATSWVWNIVCEDENISPTQRLIMIVLANYSNPEDDNLCRVPLKVLSKKTGLHLQTLSKHLNLLANSKWIDKYDNFSDQNGARIKNAYRLNRVEMAVSFKRTPPKLKTEGVAPIYNIYNNTSSLEDSKSLKDNKKFNKDTNNIKDITCLKVKEDNTSLTLKENNNIINDISKTGFDKLWFAYPQIKRGDKKQARKKYKENLKTLDHLQIYTATKNFVHAYREQQGQDLTYLKLLSTFLNTDLTPWLTQEEHPEGEFLLNNFKTQSSTIPKQYLGNSTFINPDYTIWETKNQMNKIKEKNGERNGNPDPQHGYTSMRSLQQTLYPSDS
jgi:hypothetical protein